MKLKIDGKPCVFTHKCEDEQQGTELTAAELEQFALESFMEALKYTNKNFAECHAEAKEKYDSDLIIKFDGRYLLGFVKYFESEEEEREFLKLIYGDSGYFESHYPNAWKNYQESGGVVTPVFYFPRFYCIDTQGERNIAGGEYEIEFLDYEPRCPWLPATGDALSEYAMYEGYAQSWESGDDTFMRDYVLMEFRGESELSFFQFSSKAGLLARVKHQHEIMEAKGIEFTSQLVRRVKDGETGILFWRNGKRLCFVQLAIQDNRITRSYTLSPDGDFEKWKPGDRIVQSHGDHLLPFVHPDRIDDFISETWKRNQIFDLKKKTVEGSDFTPWNWVQAQYGETMRDDGFYDIAYQILFKYRDGDSSVEFVSLFPNLYGEVYRVKILEVMEWDNKMEATVRAVYEKDGSTFEFCFFATDYAYRSSKYVTGAELPIDLAGACNDLETVEKDVVLEGESAIKFLTNIGGEIRYDEDGNVEPVRMDASNLTAYLDSDPGFPDMAAFRSPLIGKIRVVSFFQNFISIANICLNNDTGIRIPLFFNGKEMPKEGDSVCGTIWMTGSIFD